MDAFPFSIQPNLSKYQSMESPVDALASLLESAEDYGKTTFELYKLKFMDTASLVLTGFVTRLSVMIVITLFVLMLSTGAALFLGELLGKTYYGFFIVSILFLIASIVMHVALFDWIKGSISESMIKQLQQNDNAWKN
jgi:uncharacterized membrane protein